MVVFVLAATDDDDIVAVVVVVVVGRTGSLDSIGTMRSWSCGSIDGSTAVGSVECVVDGCNCGGNSGDDGGSALVCFWSSSSSLSFVGSFSES